MMFSLIIGFMGLAMAATDLQTVDHVDLDRYLGKWYEISRFPNSFQKDCEKATAEYSLRADGAIEVVNTCQRLKDGKQRSVTGQANLVDTKTNAKLKVSFLPAWLRWTGIGEGDYWIIDLAPDYRYAVVSEPKRKYLWILSRTSPMNPEDYSKVLQRLGELEFDVSRLIP